MDASPIGINEGMTMRLPGMSSISMTFLTSEGGEFRIDLTREGGMA